MRYLCTFLLAMGILGCQPATSTTPPQALAPGYTSQADQTIGQSLAALHAFVQQATQDYAKLTPAQQATEKDVLNGLVAATNAADSMYLAFHAGSATLQQAQAALANAQTNQAAYTKAMGVK